MKGILTNKFLRQMLISLDTVTSLVPQNNIKALILQPTNYPFISFKRNNIETEYVKDDIVQDKVDVDIIVVSDDYSESIEIAQAVREGLDYKRYKNSADNVIIDYIVLKDSTEDVIDNAFVQTLNFELHIRNIT